MWQDIKALLFVCLGIGLYTMIRPPYLGLLNAFVKGTFSFIIGILTGFILMMYADLPELTICGFAGMGAVFAVELSDAIRKIIAGCPERIINGKDK